MSEYPKPIPRTLETAIGGDLSIIAGYTEPLVEQLVIKSQESLSGATNSVAANEGFRSSAAFQRWQRAGKQIIYLLTNSERDDLGGLAWYEPAKLTRLPEVSPAPNHAFGMSLFRGYHNKNLALPFMAATLKDYIVSSENGVRIGEFDGIWLRTKAANNPAVRAYEKFGYEAVANDKGRLTMVLSPERILGALSSVG